MLGEKGEKLTEISETDAHVCVFFLHIRLPRWVHHLGYSELKPGIIARTRIVGCSGVESVVEKRYGCRSELARSYPTFLKLRLRAEQKPSLDHSTVFVLR
jgi:hypothetical protein